ncbi:putative beta-lysine N-acetyltransferase [Fictibacillus sp. Mic-4]|uniref:putative beta-lysine N-acetyltransferase n=1 Tax=Fictibacillus sp. Mic-4 TaxID=3132826 RepID=UPI003CF0341F
MIETFYKNIQEEQEDYFAEICLDFFNERLRVDDYRGNIPSLLGKIKSYVNAHQFTKVIIKARQEHVQLFLKNGYQPEALFKDYFNGSHAVAMTKYFTNERRKSEYWMDEDELLEKVSALPLKKDVPLLPENYHLRLAETKDADGLAKLYGEVFEIYPTPMNDSTYIKKMMNDGTLFYIVETNGQIVSAASADINYTYHNAELTDCATLPEHRKFGLMKVLIASLEEELKKRQIFCAYSIARSLSFGMNAVFHQRGYEYTGRLAKNCKIFDKWEDMNLWVNDLSQN